VQIADRMGGDGMLKSSDPEGHSNVGLLYGLQVWWPLTSQSFVPNASLAFHCGVGAILLPSGLPGLCELARRWSWCRMKLWNSRQ